MCDVLLRKSLKNRGATFLVDSRKLSGEEKYSFPRGSYGSLFFTKIDIFTSRSPRLPKICTSKIVSKSATFRADISNISPQIITFLLKAQYL
jgi:hypothetical protein